MSDYPRSAAERQQLRDAHAERIRLRAEHEANRFGLSLRCTWRDHGCRNDGTNCLCRCHDAGGEDDA